MRSRVTNSRNVGKGLRGPAKSRLAIATAVTVGALALPVTVAAAATWTVGPDNLSAGSHPHDGSDCTQPDYPTPQAAHDAATAGDTILICGGSFSTGATVPVLRIAKASLTIVGAGSASTSLTTPFTSGVIELVGGADGATIEHLAIVSDQGAAPATPPGAPRPAPAPGIRTNAAVANVTVRDVQVRRAEPGLFDGYGITVHNDGVATDWLLEHVDVRDFGVGLRVRGHASGLTIRDSAFNGNNEGMSSVNPSPPPAAPRLTGLRIERSSFNGNRNKGLYFETLSDATFDRIEVVGSGLKTGTHPSPHGFEINVRGGQASDIVIRDSRFVGSDGSGINIKARADQTAGTSLEGVEITGTVVTGNALAGVTFGNAVSGASISGSTIERNGAGVANGTPSQITATGNYWGCAGGPGSDGCDTVVVLEGAAAVVADDALADPAVGRRYVERSGDDATNACLDSEQPCATVQHAVDQAQSGDTVQVGEGDFVGAVTLAGKSITIAGAGRDETTVVGSATNAAAPGCVNSTRLEKAAVCASGGANLTIRDLTVDGNEAGASGIGFQDASGTVLRVKTTKTRDTYDDDGKMRGNQRGQGIEVHAASGTARTVTVRDSLLEDFQKTGVRASGADLTINVTNTTVACSGPQAGIAANGITLFGGASGALIDNTVSDCAYTGSQPASSAGVLFHQAGTVSAVDNTVEDSDYGINVVGVAATVATISGNTLTNNVSAVGVTGTGSSATWLTIGTNTYVGNETAIEGVPSVELVTPSLAFEAKPGAYAGRQRVDVKVSGGSASIRSIVVAGDEDVFDVNASACTSATLDADETCSVWVNANSPAVDEYEGTLEVTTRGGVPVVGTTSLTATIAGTLQGDRGADGNDGAPGTNGTNGANGTDGAPGTNGTDGVNGIDGTNGTNGANGTDGSNGSNGANGNDGLSGAVGPQGAPGPAGPKGETGAPGPLVVAVSPMRITNESRVVIASVGCPSGTCKLSSSTATLKIGKRSFRLKVRTPSRVARGKAGAVTVVLSNAARRALQRSKKGVVTVRVSVDGKRAPVIKTTLRVSSTR